MSLADLLPLGSGLVAVTGDEGMERPGIGLQEDLARALGLDSHMGKKLSMLSTGSRRKVGLVALLASGATVTCLDKPFAALDAASARVLRDFLAEAADHASRTWVVADYAADGRLRRRRHIALPRIDADPTRNTDLSR